MEGQLIRYEDGYDPLDEVQRLRGAQWRVDASLGKHMITYGWALLIIRLIAAIFGRATLTTSYSFHIG